MDASDYIITIDGPVGSGKSTVGRLLAERFGLTYLDTGAMYRAVALAAQRRGIDPDDTVALGKLCEEIDISFRHDQNGQRTLLCGIDVTDDIRTPDISMLASRISALPVVREALVAKQRAIGRSGRIVVDGRDAGTVIFPHARFKFYLDATLQERAQRRYKELIAKNMDVDYNKLFSEIEKRDRDDSTRALAPLKPAPDAVIIDTTGMTIEAVLQIISERISCCIASRS
ncbi:MAG: (d)CMP kinase [Desulfobacterota bacterium]|nr:(d)CMP kinase [Thermodesulfobacteriota bacterium]